VVDYPLCSVPADGFVILKNAWPEHVIQRENVSRKGAKAQRKVIKKLRLNS
jgi:hypothetical protein